MVLLPGLEYSYFVKENRFMEILRESVVHFLKENISATGILFESATAPALGTQIPLEIPLGPGEHTLKLIGQVSRVEKLESSYDVGVAFLQAGHMEGSEIGSAFVEYLGTAAAEVPKIF